LGLREKTKRDFSTAQTDTFAGANVEEKASVCFGRNDKFVEMLWSSQSDVSFLLTTALAPVAAKLR